jgi:hypothetical protein
MSIFSSFCRHAPFANVCVFFPVSFFLYPYTVVLLACRCVGYCLYSRGLSLCRVLVPVRRAVCICTAHCVGGIINNC